MLGSHGYRGGGLTMSCKLVVSDLDGTLLTPEHRIGDYTLRVLRRLRDRGVNLILASGRHFHDIRAVSAILRSRAYTIAANGAAVYDGNGELIEMAAIDPFCLDFLISDAAFSAVHKNLYRIQDWVVERHEPRLLDYHVESGFAYRVVDFSAMEPEPVLKVFYYGKPLELVELQDYIVEQCGAQVATTFALPFTLEVMAGGVSKGAALERVRERLQLDVSEVIAFGDGLNDLEMLRTAGTGVLMGNADPQLKAALPGNPVIGCPEDEAVARHLEDIFGTL